MFILNRRERAELVEVNGIKKRTTKMVYSVSTGYGNTMWKESVKLAKEEAMSLIREARWGMIYELK